MSDLSDEREIARIQPTKLMDIFSNLCSRLLGDVNNERILRERTLIDFCKAATWIISDGSEKLPESFNALADRISIYWLHETDSETDEERKYSYIRLYQTICVLRVFLSERELEDKAFSAVEKNHSNSRMIELIGKEPGITCQRLLEDLSLSQEEVFRRTDALCRDGFLSARRSGPEQYYFLTNSGEILGHFLSGRHEKHFLQGYWSHDRVTVLITVLQFINKSNVSFNLQQVIKKVDSLTETAVRTVLWKLNYSTYMQPTFNTIQNENISLTHELALAPQEESLNWLGYDMMLTKMFKPKEPLQDMSFPISYSMGKNISLFDNGSNLYE